jgi:3alpha(or 20beta)-hydroxysteroid dehydrogenase
VIGPYLIIRAAAPYMIKQGSGSIINISSGAADGSTVGTAAHYGMLAYGVTKAALNRMTLYFSEELAEHGIAVNALYPGAVMTNSWRAVPPEMREEYVRSGMAKPPTVEVMGPTIVFLAGQTAKGLTGKVLDSDEYGKTWP